MQRGRWRDAFEAARALVREEPSAAEPWHLLSIACQQLGQADLAVKTSEKALQLEPGNGSYAVQCAMSFVLTGRVRRARELARAVEPLAAGSAAELSKLGTIMSLCGEYERAHSLFRSAEECDPESPDHVFNRAVAARALGRLQEAEAACELAIGRGLRDRRCHYVRSDLRRQTPGNNHVDELTALLEGEKPGGHGEVYLAYALGKEREDLGDWEGSFRCYSRAAQSYRRLIRYDAKADRAALEALVKHHTVDALQAMPRGAGSRSPIFVVGMPRSGTTLTERIIQGDPTVRSVGECQLLAREIGSRSRANLTDGETDRESLVRRSLAIDAEALAQAYWSETGFEDPSLRPIDKMPINYLYLGLISRAFPNAKIVAVRRSPLDSCFSAWKAFLTGPYGFTYDFEELAAYYLRFERLLDHWSRTLPASQYQELHYEELVLETEATVRRLMAFLDLSYDPALLTFHESTTGTATASAAQVRRPIYRDSVGRAEKFAPWIEPLREHLQSGGLKV
jgi:tetratricopeptide (TPR) repeat protein